MTRSSYTLQRYEETASAEPDTPLFTTRYRRRSLSEGGWIFLVSLSAYLVVTGEELHRRVIFGDGVSRVANGYFVLFSKDPHLPAIGSVWNPLPSFLLLPFLPLKDIFPALTRDGLAGGLESALFMAGTVYLLADCLARLGVSRWPRLLLTVIFAADPMIVLYAGSGESEAMLLFFMLLTVRSLISWLSHRRPGYLVAAGLALGLGYMTRYEALAAAVAASAAVAVVSFVAATGERSDRVRLAVNDVALVSFPFIFAFSLWAVADKVLVDQWFPTISSQYGNAAQVGGAKSFIESATGGTPLSAAKYAGEQLLGLEPLVLPLLLVAAFLAWRRRDLTALAAPAVLGAVLAFDNVAFLDGSSFGWLRFQIAIIPLALLLVGTIVRCDDAADHVETSGVATPVLRRRSGWARRWVALPLGLLMATAALPATTWTLTDHHLAREETATMLAAVAPHLANSEDRRHLLIFQTEKQVASAVDALHLTTGAVLTDSAYAFPVLLASRHPQRFTITSDRDFAVSVASPSRHGIRYLLVPDPSKAPSDALEKAWPGLYATGAGIAHQVAFWKGTSFNGDWKLFRVNGA